MEAFSEFRVDVGNPHLTPPELEPDIVLTEPQPRHGTPPAWTRLCTPFCARRRWQHSAALDGSITLQWVAELIAFSTKFLEGDFESIWVIGGTLCEQNRPDMVFSM
jgi:hypothetical protein